MLPGTGAPKPVPNDLIFFAYYKSVCLSLAVSLSVPPSELHVFILNIHDENQHFA